MNTDQINSAEPTKPLAWNWIVQRSLDDKDEKAIAKWQFGFISPDGTDVRVTLHKTNEGDEADQATYYATFFANHNPESFTKWDTSLSHEDSLTVWVTITHGLLDFVKKSNVQTLVFDDLANGKLKMILRSLCLDLIDANPDYDFEQTKRGQFRAFYQVKKKGVPSAFETHVLGQDHEGETATPAPQDETTGQEVAEEPEAAADAAQAAQEPAQSDSEEDKPEPRTDLVIEIGRDYSVTARDAEGHTVDRYKGKDPKDIIRWVEKKGFSGCKMKIVPKVQPPVVEPNEKEEKEEKEPSTDKLSTYSECVVNENAIIVRRQLTPIAAALMNEILGASIVCKLDEGVSFEWATSAGMDFKKALTERLLSEITSPADTVPGT